MITNRFFLPLLLVMFTPVAAWAIDNDSISIEFEDAAVKELCVENWDTDGDGELSYAEAAAVIDLGDVFSSKGNIYKFHELQYFTGLDSINSGAFSYSYNLNEITFPLNIKSIGDDAFSCCYRIYSLTFPEGLIRIGNHAFEDVYYYLTSLTLPSTLTTLGDFAFDDCHEITSVTVKNPTPVPITYGTFNGVYGKAILYVPVGSKQAYSEADGWKNFTSIEEFVDTTIIAFADPTVKSICVANWDTDGDGELSYEEAAAVTDLGEVFSNNDNISSFDEFQYFTGLTRINDNAFKLVSMNSIIIPQGVTIIGKQAFELCYNLTNIKLPEGLTEIGESAFHSCNRLTSIDIPNSVTTIRSAAFYYCPNLTSITIPQNVTLIEEYAFKECQNLKTISIPNNIINTWKDGFDDITISTIILQDGVTNISDAAFSSCISLTSIELPQSLENIGNNAFSGCKNLTDIELPQSLVEIGNNAFSGCENLTDIELPQNVANIGEWAFATCKGLKSITIPNSVVRIGSGAFYFCTNLLSITIPQNVTLIEEDSFSGCTNLTSVIIPSGVTNIKGYAFSRCSSLTSVTIPNSVTNIGRYAFNECNSLTSITIPDSVLIIGSHAFENCSLLSIQWDCEEALNTDSYFSDSSINPNRLIYVKGNTSVRDSSEIEITRNVIRDGQAEEIVLTDNEPVLIPEAFTAKEVSYTHNFSKPTIPGTASGWESIVLPFDVQTITCEGETIVPFGSETSGYSKFWLADVSPDKGFAAATSMRANTPYIIAMPNSQAYETGNITGCVTFTAADVTVQPTVNTSAECNAFSMVPCWSPIADTDSLYESIYLLNDEEYTSSTHTVYPPGSVFVRNLRTARPFEAYYIPAEGAGVKEFIPLNEAATAITSLYADSDSTVNVQCSSLFDLSGRRLKQSPRQGGLFITNGKLTAIDGKTTNHSKIQQ